MNRVAAAAAAVSEIEYYIEDVYKCRIIDENVLCECECVSDSTFETVFTNSVARRGCGPVPREEGGVIIYDVICGDKEPVRWSGSPTIRGTPARALATASHLPPPSIHPLPRHPDRPYPARALLASRSRVYNMFTQEGVPLAARRSPLTAYRSSPPLAQPPTPGSPRSLALSVL
ncbi:hypothetical protein J6590_059829 [Homalodisca vitripennis]|nr:hypothetical protein J6590_059829 [Homalodisca vitripennis]